MQGAAGDVFLVDTLHTATHGRYCNEGITSLIFYLLVNHPTLIEREDLCAYH